MQKIESLNISNKEADIINRLTPRQYHQICSRYLKRSHTVSVSPGVTVKLGTVISWSSGKRFEDPPEIASLSDPNFDSDPYYTGDSMLYPAPHIMENGWTRVAVVDLVTKGTVRVGLEWIDSIPSSWLAQANYIFRCLGISTNMEDYVALTNATFYLEFSATTSYPPAGYVFLCPPEHFRTGPLSYKIPDSPVYWSFDPAGADRLSMEEAAQFGFPSVHMSTKVEGQSWDASVYAGLRRFNEVKGFDPDSQDAARYWNLGLYQSSTQHSNDESFWHDAQSDSNSIVEDDSDDNNVLEAAPHGGQIPLRTPQQPTRYISCPRLQAFSPRR
ncbi:hypothetical protein C8R45DRAFT_120556 [Mycena sanguinolenta]|nr:hypothetical protein C8R45DRAFT_120556 [Mycena sanguinolenta]